MEKNQYCSDVNSWSYQCITPLNAMKIKSQNHQQSDAQEEATGDS